MTEILQFPTRADRPPSVYHLHRFAPGGGVLATLPIHARTDVAARRRARELDDGVRAELWSRGRLLCHFGRADHPVAAAIRLLDRPTPAAEAANADLPHPPTPQE